MKLKLLLVTLLSFLSLATSAKETIIKGKINGKLPETLYYTAPVNGSSGFDFSHKAKPDAQGNFEIKVDVDAITFIDIYYNYQSAGSLVITPGNAYGITITEIDGKINSVFTAKDLEAQNLYNTILGGHRISSALNLSREITKIETPEAIQKLLADKENNDVARFQKLLNSKVISIGFLEALKTERKYYYAVGLGYGVMGKEDFDEKTGTAISPAPEFFALWGNMLQKYGTNFHELHKNPFGNHYLNTYKIYKLYEAHNFKQINNSNMLDLFSTKKNWFDNNNLEYYIAAYLSMDLINGSKNESLLDLYNAFKKEFPKSGYIKYLDPLIAPLVGLSKQKTKLHDTATLIDNYDNINSLTELIQKFPGKKLYFDTWATWCGSCRDEFKHKENLYKLLKADDITMVYISIDEDKRDEAWKKMINYYSLDGYHIRTNKQLELDLKKISNSNGVIYIPWYILVGKDGKIKYEHAASASELDKLEEQIKSL
jgi:thiol-disulfide isomerase/thioredoxin